MISLLLMVITTTVAIVLSYRLTVRDAFSPTALFHFIFAATILFRPMTFLLGLDSGFPSHLFNGPSFGVHANTLAVALLWLISFDAGNLLLSGHTRLIGRVLPSSDGIDPETVRRAAIFLTALAVGTTMWQVQRLGGPAGLIRATKVEKVTSDVLLLRSFAVVSTVFSLAYVLREISREDGRGRRVIRQLGPSLVLLVASASCSFAWGARDSAVIALVGLMIGPLAIRANMRSRSMRFLLGVIVVIGAVVGLRLARDVLSFGEVSSPLDGESVVRQVSVAANLTKFDSFALAVRDWPGDSTYRYGQDFWDGAKAAIPGLRPEGYERTALWWAREYEPNRANGYPLTSIGEWFLNFGVAGAAVGGFLAGWVYRSLDDKYPSDRLRGPLSFAISLLVIVSFVRLGPWTSMPITYRTMIVPTLLVTGGLRMLPGKAKRGKSGPALILEHDSTK